MILEVWPWLDLWSFDLNKCWFPNSVMQCENLFQISSQSDEKGRYLKFNLKVTFDFKIKRRLSWDDLANLEKFYHDQFKIVNCMQLTNTQTNSQDNKSIWPRNEYLQNQQTE